jgi:ABC-2 type transport system ATP-binding protein
MPAAPAIRVRGLRKVYGNFEAVRGVDFEVAEGEVFGLLGPNGAGKTTIVEILEGLRTRTGGEVSVLGYDPALQAGEVKQRIGVCLQATNLPEKMQVAEAAELFAAFYHRHAGIPALLHRLQLWEKRKACYSTLSGGQKQRLALALALVNEPQLLFLDEPTAGLDPQVRKEIHGLIEEMRERKRTILLTTHYIEEAERLCDRVAIVDEGRIVAIGAPRELQQRVLAGVRVEIACAGPAPPGQPPGWNCAAPIEFNSDRTALRVAAPNPARAVAELVRWIGDHGVELVDIHIRRPALEDVFLELTGKRLRD